MNKTTPRKEGGYITYVETESAPEQKIREKKSPAKDVEAGRGIEKYTRRV